MTLFLIGLHFPFCRAIRDVLDYLSLALAQLHPNTWRTLLSCCVVWCRVLELAGEEYPNLIVTSQPKNSFMPMVFGVLVGLCVVSVQGQIVKWHMWSPIISISNIGLRSFFFFFLGIVGNSQQEKLVTWSFQFGWCGGLYLRTVNLTWCFSPERRPVLGTLGWNRIPRRFIPTFSILRRTSIDFW